MSTKIYCAYRFPLTKVEKGIRAFHKLLLEGSLEQFSDTLERLTAKTYNLNIKEIETLKPMTKEFETTTQKTYALQRLIILGDSLTKRLWNRMDCGFNAWIFDGFMYVIPWANFSADNYFAKVEKKLPSFIEDFSYWNNTDPPEDLPGGEEAWEEREKIWEKVGPGGFNPGPRAGCLVHHVVDFSAYDGTMELEKELRKLYHKNSSSKAGQ